MMPQVDSSSTKKSTELTLIDKLSRLSYQQTLKLLGSDAPRLLRAGDKWDFRLEEDVYLGPDLFRLKFPPAAGERESERVIVMISLVETSYNRLQWRCTACESLCEHVGAAFAFILDEKMTLGLAVPPPERVPVESLTEEELIRQAIDERRERARAERMTVKSADPGQPWTDYAVSSTVSGKTYPTCVRGCPTNERPVPIPAIPMLMPFSSSSSSPASGWAARRLRSSWSKSMRLWGWLSSNIFKGGGITVHPLEMHDSRPSNPSCASWNSVCHQRWDNFADGWPFPF